MVLVPVFICETIQYPSKGRLWYSRLWITDINNEESLKCLQVESFCSSQFHQTFKHTSGSCCSISQKPWAQSERSEPQSLHESLAKSQPRNENQRERERTVSLQVFLHYSNTNLFSWTDKWNYSVKKQWSRSADHSGSRPWSQSGQKCVQPEWECEWQRGCFQVNKVC